MRAVLALGKGRGGKEGGSYREGGRRVSRACAWATGSKSVTSSVDEGVERREDEGSSSARSVLVVAGREGVEETERMMW